MITSDIITVANLKPDEYTIYNISYRSAWEDNEQYVYITFTLELVGEALEHYYFEGSGIRGQFTIRTNSLWTSNEYEGEYDGEYHTITFNMDVSQCVVKYSNDLGNTFTLTEAPAYKEIGSYEVVYEISCDGYEPFSSESFVNIKGAVVSDDILRGQTLRATDADLDNLLEKIWLQIGRMGGPASVRVLDFNGDLVWSGMQTYEDQEYDFVLTTGYRLEMTSQGLTVNYQIARIGDLTGDGLINSADLLRMRQHMLGEDLLEDEFFIAGDMTDDENVNSGDLLRIKRHLLGIKLINEEV